MIFCNGRFSRNDRLISPALMEQIATLLRVIAKIAQRFKLRGSSYRPENYYMRGAGPKSKQAAAAPRDRSPTGT
jgi:hypothetical protein